MNKIEVTVLNKQTNKSLECEPVEETVCKKCWKLALKYEYEEA